MNIQESKTSGPIGMRFMVDAPEVSSELPLLIFLHGAEEVGTTLSKVLKYGPLQQLSAGVDIGEPKVIVHPQNVSGSWTVSEIDEVFEHCKLNYLVDPNRIVLMGVSLGGKGVWEYAQSPDHVKKLACIIPICGGGNDPSKAYVLVNDGIPIWAAHAINDLTVPYNTTKRMVAAINNLAGRSQALFSEYGIYGHGAWNYFLRPQYGVYDWLHFQNLKHRRQEASFSIKAISNGSGQIKFIV